MLSFEIPYRCILSKHGELLEPLPDQFTGSKPLVSAYKAMTRARILDKKCVALQRTGQLGTYPSSLGHEAIGVAIGKAMAKDDVFVPYYRDMAAQLLRGVSMKELMLYWGGDERGSDFAVPRQDFPNCVPIASQALHAAGVASAIKIRHQKRAVLTTIGDGGSSKADFLEALNTAGAWQLPVVFVIANNQWAISVPRNLQSGAQALAQKGIGAGIPSVQVDGNDFIAMHMEISQALKRATAGKGPTLIEAITYRLSDHTTADDASRYRDADEVNQAWQEEPVKRLQTFLHSQGWWHQTLEQEWLSQCQTEIEAAVAEYLATEAMPASAMMDCLWASLPRQLEQQYARLVEREGEQHD